VNLVETAVTGFAWAMTELCGHTPAGAVESYGEAIVLVTGAQTASLNYVMVNAPDPDPADVAAAAAALAKRNVPWGMEFRFEPSARILGVAEEHGLTEVSRPLFMVCPAAGLELRRDTPSGLVVEPVGADRWELYNQVLATGFGAPADLFGTTMGGPVLDLPGFRGYLARTPEGPVGTALGTLKDGALTVFNIAVVPDVRGHGIGRALTEAVLIDGLIEGAQVASLQSSPMGRPLYASMGFQEAEHWYTLERPS
jgi:ribosomal protein S18 acetylase RimI-like enzyme